MNVDGCFKFKHHTLERYDQQDFALNIFHSNDYFQSFYLRIDNVYDTKEVCRGQRVKNLSNSYKRVIATRSIFCLL